MGFSAYHRRAAGGALAAAALLGCRARAAAPPEGELAAYELAGAPDWRAALPDELGEISGLAVTPDGRLFAHGDEEGTVLQVDPRSGRILKRFALAPTGQEPDLGKKAKGNRVAGDFEGIAIAGERFFLVTSNGVLIEFQEGADGARVPYTAHETALGERCEVEGVSHDPAAEALLMLCKEIRPKAERDRVEIHAWSLRERRLEASPRVAIAYSALAPATGAREFNGSGFTFTPPGQELLLVAGPQQLFAEITLDGRVVSGGSLERSAHPQPEGTAFLPDSTLLVSSEGGRGKASLSGYLHRSGGAR